MKWYEQKETDRSVAVGSRIRLTRDFEPYLFPNRLTEEETGSLTETIFSLLQETTDANEEKPAFVYLDDLEEADRGTLAERNMIRRAAVKKPAGAGLCYSDDETMAVAVNTIDHLRIQFSGAGSDLKSLWFRADALDDRINQRCAYAFDENFGYRTAYPTSIGTGLKAYQILHLPMLESVRDFADISAEINRCGLVLAPAFDKSRDLSGCMYVLYNRRTFGVSERDIIDLVDNIAGQLIEHEQKLAAQSVRYSTLHAEDLCLRAYGLLRYARLLQPKAAMSLLSKVRFGIMQDVLSFKEDVSVYQLMLGIQPYNLQKTYGHTLEGDDLAAARADYIRTHLPKLSEES